MNYQLWLESEVVPTSMKEEIKQFDDQQLQEFFGSDLEFGTGGMRATIGPGTAKMNVFTVRKATYGLAKYLEHMYPNEADLKVAIAYDSRHFSREFSQACASVLALYGISTLIYQDERPTPMLSFLVREQNCHAGIVITASHNPKEYNGYKIYNNSGAQLNLDQADLLIGYANEITNPLDVEFLQNYESFVSYIDESYDEVYLDAIDDIMINDDVDRDLKIVFTPEHGTSGVIMPKAFAKFGFTGIIEVKEQMMPDPNFSNTKSSNPEDIEAYELAIEYGEKHQADLIIANDPDADRLGILVSDSNNKFHALSGNLTGAVMIDYILKHKKLKGNEVIFQTIVTGELGSLIAKKHGVQVEELLTGFKFIGQALLDIEQQNLDKEYLFGYEESYGYLIKPCVRDKDAISASVLIAEIVSYYKTQGLTLLDVIENLYQEYGYYSEITHAISLKGSAGLEKIKNCMAYVKATDIKEIAGIEVVEKLDYSQGVNGLPKSDVVKFYLKDTGWLVFRPSGTEPKLKIYISVKAEDEQAAKALNHKIFEEMQQLV